MCLFFSGWTIICMYFELSKADTYSSWYQKYISGREPWPLTNSAANTTTADASNVRGLQSIHHSPIIYQALSPSLFTLSLFIYQTLQTKRKPADPEEHLACCDINHLTYDTHTEKKHEQQKNFISNPSVNQQQRNVTIFHVAETVAALQMLCVCVCVCQGWLDTD